MERIRCRMKALDQRLTQVKKELGKLIRQLSPECQPDNLEPSVDRIDLYISQILEEIVSAAQTQEVEKKVFKLDQKQRLISECYDRRAMILLERIPTYDDPPLDYSEDLPTPMLSNSGSAQPDLNFVYIKDEIPSTSWNFEEYSTQEELDTFQDDSNPSPAPSEDPHQEFLPSTPPKIQKKRRGKSKRPKIPQIKQKKRMGRPKGSFKVPRKDTTSHFHCPIKKCTKIYPLHREIAFEFHKLLHSEPSLSSYKIKPRTGACPLCPKTFPNSKATPLQFHILSTHFNIIILPFPCSIPGCDKRFKSVGDLNKHTKSHSSTSHPCPECGNECISELSLQVHKAAYHGPLKCDYCPRTFTKKDALDRHSKEHETTIVCELCGKAIPKSKLQDHMYSAHRAHNCGIGDCSLEFSSREERRIHWKSEHTPQFICDQCTKSHYTLRDLNIHRKIHEPSFICSWEGCGRSYVSKSDFTRHEESHKKDLESQNQLRNSEDPTFPCDLCGCVYALYKSLIYHKKTAHVEDSNFICGVEGCGKAFKSTKALSNHKSYVHNKREISTCEICFKKFCSKVGLRDHHYRIHRKDLRLGFNCEICGISFKVQKLLDNHLKKAHGQAK